VIATLVLADALVSPIVINGMGSLALPHRAILSPMTYTGKVGGKGRQEMETWLNLYFRLRCYLSKLTGTPTAGCALIDIHDT
jgi:hypothetical protein